VSFGWMMAGLLPRSGGEAADGEGEAADEAEDEAEDEHNVETKRQRIAKVGALLDSLTATSSPSFMRRSMCSSPPSSGSRCSRPGSSRPPVLRGSIESCRGTAEGLPRSYRGASKDGNAHQRASALHIFHGLRPARSGS